MNLKIEGYNTLVFLHQHIGDVIRTFPMPLDDKHIDSIRFLHRRSEKLLRVWDDAIIETLEGYEVEPTLLRPVVNSMARMIVVHETLSKELDPEACVYFEDISLLLECLSKTFFEIEPMHKTP